MHGSWLPQGFPLLRIFPSAGAQVLERSRGEGDWKGEGEQQCRKNCCRLGGGEVRAMKILANLAEEGNTAKKIKVRIVECMIEMVEMSKYIQIVMQT